MATNKIKWLKIKSNGQDWNQMDKNEIKWLKIR